MAPSANDESASLTCDGAGTSIALSANLRECERGRLQGWTCKPGAHADVRDLMLAGQGCYCTGAAFHSMFQHKRPAAADETEGEWVGIHPVKECLTGHYGLIYAPFPATIPVNRHLYERRP